MTLSRNEMIYCARRKGNTLKAVGLTFGLSVERVRSIVQRQQLRMDVSDKRISKVHRLRLGRCIDLTPELRDMWHEFGPEDAYT